MNNRNKPLWESLGILLVVIVLIRVCFELRHVSWFSSFVPLAVAAILIYVPVLHSRYREFSLNYIDRNWSDVKRSLKWFGLSVLFIIPPFLIANNYWQEWVFNRAFLPHMVPKLGLLIVDQLFLVAIPEEIFFRGWLQSRLQQTFKPRWNIFGVKLGPAWLLTAVLFATAHSMIFFQWWHFAIFFPALVFGWLREKTGTILAPALFHAAANIATYWIGISYV